MRLQLRYETFTTYKNSWLHMPFARAPGDYDKKTFLSGPVSLWRLPLPSYITWRALEPKQTLERDQDHDSAMETAVFEVEDL